MIKSLLRRILYVVLLLWIVSVISFWLSKQVPGDEVLDYISIDDRGLNISSDPYQFRQAYQRVAKIRELDNPEFYFSINGKRIPKEVHDIIYLNDRIVVKQWIHQSDNGDAALKLYRKLENGLQRNCPNTFLCSFYNQALSIEDIPSLDQYIRIVADSIKLNALVDSSELLRIDSMNAFTAALMNNGNRFGLNNLPVFRWHGADNQYHQWISGLLAQKPLISLVDGRNAWSKIYDALKWTLLMNGIALIISLIAGVFIGIWSGKNDGSPGEKTMNWILFALYALPSFWLGTIFIYLFASGEWLSILPAGGLGDYQKASSLKQWLIIGYHLLLPVMCLALGSLAYISRQMKQSVIYEYKQPYIGMLRAQGVSEKTILHKHVFRNALFPVITLLGGTIPALLSGSLVIEIIFSIPGMGRLIFTSIIARDWPVAFPILMLVALITILSYILTDILYKSLDPRVKVLET